MRILIIIGLIFFMVIEFQKIQNCEKGKYDFDYGVCRE